MSTARNRAAEYHADMWAEDRPSLSSSIAATLILKTPAHARAKHPKLTDHPVTESTYSMNLGTTVHAILLHDDRVDVVPFDDFRKAEAREARDASLERGRVPVTRPMWDEAGLIASHVALALRDRGLDPVPFTDGQAEYVIRYKDNGADCRAMLDWLRHDRNYIDDLKTTFDASPGKVSRHIFNMGYDIRAAFYIRAVMAEQAADGLPSPRVVFRWVFVETKPPYPVTIATLTERAMESAHVKVDEAIRLWNQCLETGHWPAYPSEPLVVDLPAWQIDASDRWGEIEIEDGAPF